MILESDEIGQFWFIGHVESLMVENTVLFHDRALHKELFDTKVILVSSLILNLT